MNISEKRKVTFSFVAPVRNVRDSLETFITRLSAMGDRMGESYEIIFVDDGSTDGTGDRLASLAEKNRMVTAVELSRQFGADAAVLAGYQHSSGKAVISLDCTRHAVDAIVDLISRWREGFEIVSVVESAQSAEKVCPFTDFIKGRGPVIPAQSVVFRLMDRKCVDAIIANAHSASTMAELLDWVGFRRAEIPAAIIGAGQNNFSTAERETASTGHQIARKVSILGMAMMGAAAVYALTSLVLWPFGMMLNGWFHLGAVLVALFGLEFLMVGMIAYYVRRATTARQSVLRYAVRSVIGAVPEKSEPLADDDDESLPAGYRPIMLLT